MPPLQYRKIATELHLLEEHIIIGWSVSPYLRLPEYVEVLSQAFLANLVNCSKMICIQESADIFILNSQFDCGFVIIMVWGVGKI